MAVEVFMPALGASQDTGTLISWLKGEGEMVSQGESLMLIETDKTTLEIESPGTGTLVGVCASEGDELPIGTTMAYIVADGEAPPTMEELEPATVESETPVGSAPMVPPIHRSERTHSPGGAVRVQASPKVRRIADERGIDLSTIAGSGPDGAILASDLTREDDPRGAHRRAAVVRAMAQSVTRSWQNVPHTHMVREIDATSLVDVLPGDDDHASIVDLLIVALARVLSRNPTMNANSSHVSIGVTTSTPDGLFVPVVRDASTSSLLQITAERTRLEDRVRTRQHTTADLVGATFTLNTVGMTGVDYANAIVSESQVGTLSVGRLIDRIVARDGEPVVAPTMTLSLSCDHRIVDGFAAASFLSDVANQCMAPDSLLEPGS